MPPIGNGAMGGPCEFCMYARARTELTIKELQAGKKPSQTNTELKKQVPKPQKLL